MRISDWSSDVCSSDLLGEARVVDRALKEDFAGGIFGDGFPESAELDPAIADVERDDLIGRGPLVIALDRTKAETRQIDGAGRDRPHQTAVPIAEFTHIRSEEHTSDLPSLMPPSSAVFCLTQKTTTNHYDPDDHT